MRFVTDFSFENVNKGVILKRVALFVFIVALNRIGQSATALQEATEPQFAFQQAQDLFESSIPTLITNPRSSDRAIAKCLELEPENHHCLYLRFFINRRLGRESKSALEQIKFLLWQRKVFDQKRDQTAMLLINNFESKMASKNYAAARQALDRLNAEFPDYPDLVIMKRNLNFLSSERPPGDTAFNYNVNNAFEVYQKRCRNLDGMTVRKYLFDIDLCRRQEMNSGYEQL